MDWRGVVLAISVGLALTGRVHAQALKGGPGELVGHFGNSPAQCQSWNRKTDGISSFTKEFYTWCGGSGCEARIESHRKTKNGFILRFVSSGNPDGWTRTVTVLDKNVIEVDKETLVRCGLDDIRAGVGRDAGSAGALTKSLDVAFSAYYALEVQKKCASLKADAAKAVELLHLAETRWKQFLVERNLRRERGAMLDREVRADVERQKISAAYAVRTDGEKLPDFCDEALKVFGPGGRLMPDLLKDTRRGA